MASTAPREPELYQGSADDGADTFHVDELRAEMAGAMSPFGPELQFPLPPEKLRYSHPGPKSRPHLAGGR